MIRDCRIIDRSGKSIEFVESSVPRLTSREIRWKQAELNYHTHRLASFRVFVALS